MQRDAAADANALQREQFNDISNNLSPYRQYGSDAVNRLGQLLGIAPKPSVAGVPPLPTLDQAWAEVDRRHREVYGTDSPRGPIQQIHAQNEFEKLMRSWDQQRQDAEAAAGSSTGEVPGYGSLLEKFTGKDLEQEPGYMFGLQQGQQALDRRLASGGNYFSGAALKGATRFAQDYAGTKYGEAFNRDAADKTRIFNFLSGAASLGENAAAQTGNAGQNMANQVGANTMGAANAAGAAQIASSNAITGAGNNMMNYYSQNQLLNAITSGNRPWGSTSNNLANGPSNNAGMYTLDSSFDQYRQP
jgi:hypothetical protein